MAPSGSFVLCPLWLELFSLLRFKQERRRANRAEQRTTDPAFDGFSPPP